MSEVTREGLLARQAELNTQITKIRADMDAQCTCRQR